MINKSRGAIFISKLAQAAEHAEDERENRRSPRDIRLSRGLGILLKAI